MSSFGAESKKSNWPSFGKQHWKTTLAECFLFNAGVIDRRGRIETKNTVSDFNSLETKEDLVLALAY